MRRGTLPLLAVGLFALFFVLVPVVPTHLVPCLVEVGPSLDYASLSNHFLGIGAVYLPTGGPFGYYQFWTHGVIYCI